jgi:hypothetical protein
MRRFDTTITEEGVWRGYVQASQQKDISQSQGHRPMTE